jgi:transposase
MYTSREEEMLHMNQIEQVKELQRQGLGATKIAARLGIDRKTVAKYMLTEDYNQALPQREETASKLDRWKAEIDKWLEEDRRMRFKQRHTARRIHHRLLEEHPGDYDCSYPLVQRYVKKRKTMRKDSPGFLELVWEAGVAQGDFGEADIIEAGVRRTIKYLTLSFPASNAGYLQGFGGETAECVCQGLQDIFHHIGGVPGRIVFDNASGVGRRVRDRVSFSELFMRFKCHYGFSVSFCNPASGNEKGNVENKVGYLRRNLLVPIPEIQDLESWNRQLLEGAERDFQRPHYKKGLTIRELFAEERSHLGPLPAKPFNIERFQRANTDGYGKFCIDGRHWYSSSPESAGTQLTIGIKAHWVEVHKTNGELLCSHRRIYGEERSDSVDYLTSLETLVKKTGAWPNSALRAGVGESTRASLDAMTKPDLRRVLSVLSKSSASFGYEVALDSLEEALKRGAIDSYSVQAIAARLAFDGLQGSPLSGPDLEAYDRAFIEGKGGRQ